MQKFELNDDNVVLFLMKHYDNPGCSGIQEFYDDVKRFKYVRRLFKKYDSQGELRERLIINHLVVLSNLFGVETLSKVLAYKIDVCFYKYLKPFMLYLNMNAEEITCEDMDQHIIDVLRKI
jgi:hypothetical protein